MSTDTANAPSTAGEVHDDHHGPTDKTFVNVAILLAGITAVEVLWHYLPWPDDGGLLITFAQVGGLLAMMAWKFYVVASVFMHLKFDHKLLTGVFYAGLVLAVAVYVAALVTFELFSSGTPGFTP